MNFKRRRLSRSSNIPIRFLIPNAITILGLGAGLTSIRMAYEERFELAIFAILVAALLDGMDGSSARLLKATSKFGAELDSLSDFVNFGVAPCLIIYFWSLKDIKGLGWIVTLIYAVCICLRLARFNIGVEEEKSLWKTRFFSGVPAPASAGLLLMPFYTRFLDLKIIFPPHLVMAYTIFISLLAASHIPTFSPKSMGSIPRRTVRMGLVAIILIASILATYTWETLIAFGILYLLSIPLSSWAYFRLEHSKPK